MAHNEHRIRFIDYNRPRPFKKSENLASTSQAIIKYPRCGFVIIKSLNGSQNIMETHEKLEAQDIEKTRMNVPPEKLRNMVDKHKRQG